MSNKSTPELNSICIKGKLMHFDQPKIMGVINATPDSFYSASRIMIIDDALLQVGKMISEGMDILDVGSISSRPGAEFISEKEEEERLLPLIEEICQAYPLLPVSVDTFRWKVAEKAIEKGASIVNDITGGHFDADMLVMASQNHIPYIAMHMKGTPKNMMEMTQYENILTDMIYYFSKIIEHFHRYGGTDIIIDPGFGFAKTIDQNFYLLHNLEAFYRLECPLMVGFSRKSMIWRTLSIQPEEALNGTTVLNTLALEKGVDILRVHDVNAAKEAIKLVAKYKSF